MATDQQVEDSSSSGRAKILIKIFLKLKAAAWVGMDTSYAAAKGVLLIVKNLCFMKNFANRNMWSAVIKWFFNFFRNVIIRV